MTRKKALIWGGVLMTLTSAAGAGVAFLDSSMLAYVPFIGEKSAPVELDSTFRSKVETHQPDPELLKEGDKVANGEAEHSGADTEHDGHGAAANAGKDKKVELVPAPDFVAPQSRRSTAIKAIREMNVLQTRMAEGNSQAPQALKSVMLRVPALLSGLDVSKISDAEIQSVALYVLSGGNPAVVSRILKEGTLTPVHQALLGGVESYATADLPKASELLLPLDPKKFETSLSAQLAMTQAQLATEAASSANISRLAFSANVMPGSLIEEAAIRRILPHLASAGEVSRFSYWSQRYLRRFPNSLYYQDFEVVLVNAATKLFAGDAGLSSETFAEILRTAGEKRAASLARKILLRVILEGNEVRCSMIEKSLNASFDLELDSFRAAAVLIRICKSTGGGAEELVALKSIDSSALDEDVRRHLSKAIVMSDAINKDVPPQDDGRAGPHLPLSAEEAFAPLFASVAQQMDASLSAIRSVDDDEAGTSK